MPPTQVPVIFDAVPPKNYPREKGTPVETYPIQGSTTTPFFPPVCLKSHWDPTQIYQKTVPNQHVALPIDFRPWTKVCMEYVTAGPVEALPPVPDSVVFPSGGEFYPPQRWSNNIDNDSLTRRLDRPLGTCEDNQLQPHVEPNVPAKDGGSECLNHPGNWVAVNDPGASTKQGRRPENR